MFVVAKKKNPKKRVHALTLYLEKPNDQKKDTAELKHS